MYVFFFLVGVLRLNLYPRIIQGQPTHALQQLAHSNSFFFAAGNEKQLT